MVHLYLFSEQFTLPDTFSVFLQGNLKAAILKVFFQFFHYLLKAENQQFVFSILHYWPPKGVRSNPSPPPPSSYGPGTAVPCEQNLFSLCFISHSGFIYLFLFWHSICTVNVSACRVGPPVLEFVYVLQSIHKNEKNAFVEMYYSPVLRMNSARETYEAPCTRTIVNTHIIILNPRIPPIRHVNLLNS